MPRSVRLGCLPHDPARAALLPAARYGAALPPASIPVPTWQPAMLDNDTLPNCTAVALANAARAWAHRQERLDVLITAPAVDALYAAAIGMPGATAAQLAVTDGADPLAVVEQAQARGFNVGSQVPLVPDFATVAVDRTALANAMARAGGVMLALTLYAADMADFEAGRSWVGALSGFVAGGHMVCACAYDGLGDADAVHIATWGAWQPASWGWVLARARLGVATGWRQLTAPGADYAAAWGAEIA